MNYFYQFSITIHLCYISNARCILKLVILLWKNAWYFWLLIYSLGWRNILFLQKYNQNEFFKETTQIFKILGKLNFIEIAALYIRCFSFKWNLHCFINNIDLAQLFCVSLLLLRDGEGMSQYMYIAFISSQVFMWYIAFKLHIFQFRFVLLTWTKGSRQVLSSLCISQPFTFAIFFWQKIWENGTKLCMENLYMVCYKSFISLCW